MIPPIRITAYENYLIIDASDMEDVEDPNWVQRDSQRVGCVISNAQNYLGISTDAFDILKNLKKSVDAIGEVMWWRGESICFGWLGGVRALVSPKGMGDRNFQVFPDSFTIIPNDVPDAARETIDTSGV